MNESSNQEGFLLITYSCSLQSDPTESDLDDRLFPDSIVKPDKAGEVVQGVSFVDLRGEKASKKYGLYRGTLTYPPCTRNVNWLVSAEMHPVRADQGRNSIHLTSKKSLRKLSHETNLRMSFYKLLIS